MTFVYTESFMANQACRDYKEMNDALQQRWLDRPRGAPHADQERADDALRNEINRLTDAAIASRDASLRAQGLRVHEYWTESNQYVVDLLADEVLDLLAPPPVEPVTDPEQSMFEP
jgi:hypothetical protein